MKGFCRARLTVFRLLFVIFAAFPAAALQAERVDDLPKPTDYVSDLAHVLSPPTVAQIDSICSQLDHSKANAQIAVVTVRTLDGDDSAEYATDLYHKWGIGKKGEDRGVLVLLAVQDHKRWITTGYGLEGILNDAKVGDIGRAMVPLLRANNYDGAVLLAVGDIGQVIAADAGITLQNAPSVPAPQKQIGRHHFAVTILFFVVVLLFFVGSPILRLLLGYSILTSGFRGPGVGGGPFIGGGGFGGGGGDSGGGGGFGGFGGGDSGGGGAGGDW
jgi:uncharacterized protein